MLAPLAFAFCVLWYAIIDDMTLVIDYCND